MKSRLIRCVSDLHLECVAAHHVIKFVDMVIPPMRTDEDTVLTIAGDLGNGHLPHTWFEPLKYLCSRFKAVVCVCGNHFFYYNRLFGNINDASLEEIGITSDNWPENLFFLEDASVEIDDVLFIGSTLWTDMRGENPLIIANMNDSFSDYYYIRNSDGKRIKAESTIVIHKASKKFIFDEVKGYDGRTVVLTHHCPSKRSTHPKFAYSDMNPAFTNEMDSEIHDNGPTLWHHGHTHSSFDYMANKSRIICNPVGNLINPNIHFDKSLLIGI